MSDYKDHYDNSYALVIGIDDFQAAPPLHTARYGAEAVAALLKQRYSFNQVITLYDDQATRSNIEDAYADLRNTMGDDDRFVVYWAGHGVGIKGQHRSDGFLVAHDSDLNRRTRLIKMRDIADSNFTRAKHAFVILDTCHSGFAVTYEKPRDARSIPNQREALLRHFLTRRAYQVFASANPLETATDAGLLDGHTPFTGSLLRALSGDETARNSVSNLLTASSLAEYVRNSVAAFSGNWQGPQIGILPGDLGGELVWEVPTTWDELPEDVQQALDKLRPAGHDRLIHPYWNIRIHAIDKVDNYLGDSEIGMAVREVFEYLAVEDPHDRVRKSAQKALDDFDKGKQKRAKELEEAQERIRQELEQRYEQVAGFKQWIDSLYDEAQHLFDTADLDGAETALGHLKEAYPDDPRIDSLWQEIQTARAEYERNEEIDSLLSEVNSWIVQHDWDEAEAVLQQIRELIPDDPRLDNLRQAIQTARVEEQTRLEQEAAERAQQEAIERARELMIPTPGSVQQLKPEDLEWIEPVEEEAPPIEAPDDTPQPERKTQPAPVIEKDLEPALAFEKYEPESMSPASSVEKWLRIPKKAWMWIGGTIGVVLLIGLLAIFWPDKEIDTVSEDTREETSTSLPTATSQPTDNPSPTATTLPDPTPSHAFMLAETGVTANADWQPYIQEFNGVYIALVPAGCFMMGSESGDSDAMPIHEVCFDEPFWIDVYEVTNAQYGSYGNWAMDNFPREKVNWFDSFTHCASRGARLPTEVEWEYAARGPDGLAYPWGNDFDGSLTNFCDKNCSEDGAGKDSDDGYKYTSPVGSYPEGTSWVGALDMSGNVSEWISDWFGPYTETQLVDPQGPEISSTGRVVRGAAWVSQFAELDSAYRQEAPPYNSYNDVGFRCAYDYNPEFIICANEEFANQVNVTPSCEKAVDQAAETEDIEILSFICENSTIAELVDVSPACDRLAELALEAVEQAAQSDDLGNVVSILMQDTVIEQVEDISPAYNRVVELATEAEDIEAAALICTNGTITGQVDARPICDLAIELAAKTEDISAAVQICLSRTIPEVDASPACEQTVEWVLGVDDAINNNIVCWQGSLLGYAEIVMPACEHATEIDPDHGGFADSRGLARALTGDFEGAIEDFRFYIEWEKENNNSEEHIQKREAWIAALEAGENPFDEETLEALWDE